MSREPFDLSDLKLNLESDQQTSWGNFGCWQHSDGSAIKDYPTAAEELAHRHAIAAQLGPTTRLLDLACGCGDQLLLWHQHYGVERITAVNLSSSQTAFAQSKLQRAIPTNTSIHLRQADAVAFLQAQPNASFDAVIAVDGAYHFRPWNDFLDHAGRVLMPGGRLVISTLCYPEALTRGQKLRVLPSLWLTGVVPASLDVATIKRKLSANEIDITSIEDMTPAVFDGFIQWWSRYTKSYASEWPAVSKLRYRITVRWLEAASKRGWPTYQLLTAVKR